MINQLAVVLRPDTRKARPLRLRDSQLFEGILDIVGDLLPAALHIRIRPDVGHDIVNIQPADIRTPVRYLQLVIYFQRLQPELPHPLRIMLLLRYFQNNVLGQPLLDPEKILFLVAEVIKASVYIVYFASFFFHSFQYLPVS